MLNNIHLAGGSPGDFVKPELPGGSVLFPDPGKINLGRTGLQWLDEYFYHPDLFDKLLPAGTRLAQQDIRHIEKIADGQGDLHYSPIKSKWIRGIGE